MKTVILKNGAEEAEGLVAVTMLSMGDLGPIELYEMVQVCRNPNHEMWGDTGKKLKSLNLLEPDGRVHDSIRNIILSAAVGEGLDLQLGNPIKEEENDGRQED